MTEVKPLGQSKLELIENLKKIVEMAYDEGRISRVQNRDEIVYTIRIPHASEGTPEFNLFRFAAEIVA